MLGGLKNMKNTCYTKVTWAFKETVLIFNTSFTKIKSLEIKHSIEFNCKGLYTSWKPLIILEFQESDFKALKVLETGLWSLKVLDFLLNKIEKYLVLKKMKDTEN